MTQGGLLLAGQVEDGLDVPLGDDECVAVHAAEGRRGEEGEGDLIFGDERGRAVPGIPPGEVLAAGAGVALAQDEGHIRTVRTAVWRVCRRGARRLTAVRG